MADPHKWVFQARFRRGAFGWRSQPAITRVKEAVSEIKKVARRDPAVAAEGAVRFLERVSPALENVDSSSGAIGTAVNRAIDALVPIIADAPVDAEIREKWLQRLWQAHMDDEIPYIEALGDQWGRLCASPETASSWADRLVDQVELHWTSEPGVLPYFQGTSACLSSLCAAGRHEELLELLDKAPVRMWAYDRWGVEALVALGRRAEALRRAEASSRDPYGSPATAARACEEILLSTGLTEEAFDRYAFVANRGTSYLATYRAIVKKYRHLRPAEILAKLVRETPGEEGKWFAAAKEAGLKEEAIELANSSPVDPRTLTRAARDHRESDPGFAVEAGIAALRWLAAGYGYEITGADVDAAYHHTMAAAERAGATDGVRDRVRRIISSEKAAGGFIGEILARRLESS